MQVYLSCCGPDFVEVGYLNSEGEIILNLPEKEVDLNSLSYCYQGFLVFIPDINGNHTINDMKCRNEQVYPTNDIGELIVECSPNAKSLGYFQDGRVVFWEQYQ